MELDEAVSLIDHPSVHANTATAWADFGSGAGIFTNALATLLQPASKIIAIDKNLKGFKDLRANSAVMIENRQGDFTNFLPGLTNLTGILMANSLHFVSDKETFLMQSFQYFATNETFLIVEYDMNQPNAWVPYPIPFSSLRELFASLGFSEIEKISEMRSRYNRSNIYSAVVMR